MWRRDGFGSPLVASKDFTKKPGLHKILTEFIKDYVWMKYKKYVCLSDLLTCKHAVNIQFLMVCVTDDIVLKYTVLSSWMSVCLKLNISVTADQTRLGFSGNIHIILWWF